MHTDWRNSAPLFRKAFIALCVLGLAACSRGFQPLSDVPRLTGIEVLLDGGGGQVLLRPGDIPVVRGALTVRVAATADAPLQGVEFVTPGRLPEIVPAPDLVWQTETSDIYPEGGVLAVTATPIGLSGVRGTPVEASYIVDNAAPTVTLQSPADGSTVQAGTVVVVACAKDRLPDTPVNVLINGLPTTDAGPNCHASVPFDAEPSADGGLHIQGLATDDVGNTRAFAADFSVTRTLADIQTGWTFEEDISGDPYSSFAPPMPQAYPGGVVASEVAGAAPAAAWLHGDGTLVESGLSTAAGADVLGIPGADGLAVAFALYDGGNLTPAPNYTLYRDGVQLGPTLYAHGPAAWDQPELVRDSAPAGACFTPTKIDGVASTVDCFLPDAGHVSRAFQSGQAGWYLQNFTVVGNDLWLSAFDKTGGEHLGRWALPDLSDTGAVSGTTSMLDECYAHDARGAACNQFDPGLPPVRVDAVTEQITPIPNLDDCSGAGGPRCVALTADGVLTAVSNPSKLRTDIVEYPMDGQTPRLWGCFPEDPGDTSIQVELASDGRLYVAGPRQGGRTLEVRAFSAPDQLSWVWSTRFTNASDTTYNMVLDDSSPTSPLWLVLDVQGEAFALARTDPQQPANADPCP